MNENGSLLLIDKPAGWTSFDVVAYMRGLLRASKTGHCGTLDPLASGLLILLFGKATKLQKNYLHLPKIYEGQILLGIETDSWDMEGKIIKEQTPPEITPKALQKAIAELTGEITQPVPYFSAKKVNGKKMYAAARQGVFIEKQTVVTVEKWPKADLKDNIIDFEVCCSSGTYVRSLAYMLGQKLGAAACLKTLRRTQIGPFNVKDALALEKAKTMNREEAEKWLKTL